MRELKTRRSTETTYAAGSRACGDEALEAQLVRQAPHWCLSLWHCSRSGLDVLNLRGLQGPMLCEMDLGSQGMKFGGEPWGNSFLVWG